VQESVTPPAGLWQKAQVAFAGISTSVVSTLVVAAWQATQATWV
jgi:hypothetical protein